MVVLSKDQALKNCFMFLKELTYHQEHWEIKWSIPIQDKLCRRKERLMMISDYSWNMWDLSTLKTEKEVSTQLTTGKMCFQEDRNRESRWPDSSIINQYSEFLTSVQVQWVWTLRPNSTQKQRNWILPSLQWPIEALSSNSMISRFSSTEKENTQPRS